MSPTGLRFQGFRTTISFSLVVIRCFGKCVRVCTWTYVLCTLCTYVVCVFTCVVSVGVCVCVPQLTYTRLVPSCPFRDGCDNPTTPSSSHAPHAHRTRQEHLDRLVLPGTGVTIPPPRPRLTPHTRTEPERSINEHLNLPSRQSTDTHAHLPLRRGPCVRILLPRRTRTYNLQGGTSQG